MATTVERRYSEGFLPKRSFEEPSGTALYPISKTYHLYLLFEPLHLKAMRKFLDNIDFKP